MDVYSQCLFAYTFQITVYLNGERKKYFWFLQKYWRDRFTYSCSLRFLKGVILVLVWADAKESKAKTTSSSTWNWSVMGCVIFPCAVLPAQSEAAYWQCSFHLKAVQSGTPRYSWCQESALMDSSALPWPRFDPQCEIHDLSVKLSCLQNSLEWMGLTAFQMQCL